MLDNESFKLIKRHTPKQGVGERIAVCLGDQKPVFGSGFQSIGDVFAALGYKRTVTLDYDGKADVTHNLNYPLPNPLWGIGDVVYDGGTSEHVANIGESLTTMVRLPRIGGLICQIVPMNCYGGSYYGLDPLLLHDFYTLNGFRQLELWITHSDSWRFKCIRLASRYLPAKVVEAVRLRLSKTNKAKTFVLAEASAKKYQPAPDYAYDERYNNVPIFRDVPVLAMALYLGIKEQEIANIKWPAQRDYASHAA